MKNIFFQGTLTETQKSTELIKLTEKPRIHIFAKIS